MTPTAQELLSFTWRLGSHKSDIKWSNQLTSRNWTKAKITDTIRNGTPYPAPNKPNPSRTATRYERGEDHVVVDDVTREVLQVSGLGHFASELP
jgi:hypothetical protein